MSQTDINATQETGFFKSRTSSVSDIRNPKEYDLDIIADSLEKYMREISEAK